MQRFNASINLQFETSEPMQPSQIAERLQRAIAELGRIERAVRAQGDESEGECTVNMTWSTDRIPDCELFASVGNVGVAE